MAGSDKITLSKAELLKEHLRLIKLLESEIETNKLLGKEFLEKLLKSIN
jgi:hypothetical protein